jgi:hypothetical protein
MEVTKIDDIADFLSMVGTNHQHCQNSILLLYEIMFKKTINCLNC